VSLCCWWKSPTKTSSSCILLPEVWISSLSLSGLCLYAADGSPRPRFVRAGPLRHNKFSRR
jgi:hypothetical protein